MRANGGRIMLVGGLVCLAGIVATAMGASASESNHGGTYVVFYGAIIYGAIQFFRGLFAVAFNR